MHNSSTWRVCRSCAQRYSLRPPKQLLAGRQLRQFTFPPQAWRGKNETADEKEDAKQNVEVRYYEQFAPGPKGMRRIDESEFEERETADEIKARIAKLEAQLAELEAGKDVEGISPADRKILENVMAAEPNDDISGKDLKGLLDGSEDDLEIRELANALDLEFHLPPEHQRSLGTLARLLQNSAKDIGDPRTRRLLWQQYTKCKDELSGFEQQLPESSWKVLWQSQYENDSHDRLRGKHLYVLAEDMARARQDLSIEQTIIRIEGRVVDGKYTEAFKIWEAARINSHQEKYEFIAFQDLGPRLLALLRVPKDAQALAFELATDAPRISIFVPVLEGWLKDGDKNSVKRAWALYLRLRQLMKHHMALEDYDLLVMVFFKAGQKESALAIFKDLVLCGRTSEYDSLAVRNKSMDMVRELIAQPQDVEALNQLSLSSLTFLPRSFQNKYFYAMWMKRLLGMGEIEAAASVIELMHLRSVRADPRHINGLIGALFRRGRPSDKDTAINLAWAMINERIKFVKHRQAQSLEPPTGSSRASESPNESMRLPPYLSKNLPPATTETFALLVLHYTRASMTSSVDRLHAALIAAELTPNIYYINHLLYGRLRAGDCPGLWNLYLAAIESHHTLRPDLSTFTCLWDAEKAHVTANPETRRELALQAQANFPGPRKLFAHMTRWLESLSPKEREEVKAEFAEDHSLYTQIVRCFCLTLDLPGVLIALYSMRDIFGVYPDADDVRLISIQLARSSEPVRGGWKKRRVGRLGDRKESQERLQQAAELLKIMQTERRGVLASKGFNEDELGPTEQAEENLCLTGGLIRKVMEAKAQEIAIVAQKRGQAHVGRESNDVEKVAWKMGVGPLQLGAPSYEKHDGLTELIGFEGETVGRRPQDTQWSIEDGN